MALSSPPIKKARVADSAFRGELARPRNPQANLAALPHDILLLIIGLIGIEDIVALRRTSKKFGTVTKLRWVWQDILRRQVMEREIPVPASVPDLKVLSSEQLEARAMHATTFENNWMSPSPRPRRIFEYGVASGEPVSHVRILPGYNGELVVSVQRSRVICWEIPLSGEDAFIVAEREIPGATIQEIVVNEDPKSPAKLALVWSQFMPPTNPTPTWNEPSVKYFIEAWSIDCFYGKFTTLRSDSVPGDSSSRIKPIHSFAGDIVLVGDPVAVWNWANPKAYTVLNASIGSPPVPDNLLAVKAVRDYLIVVRQSHLQLLPLPCFGKDGLPLAHTTYRNSAYIHLPDVATSCSIVVHQLPPEERARWTFEPVTIVRRMAEDGGHAVRTYAIAPRLANVGDPEGACCSGCGAEREEHPERMTDIELQLPFRLPKAPAATHVVPRSCGNLTIGSQGRGLWLETRVAGRPNSTYPVRAFVGFDVRARHIEVEGSREGLWQFRTVVRKRAMYTARMSKSEFGVREGEEVEKKYRILDTDIEATVGRVAVGCRDGRVQIMDLA